MTPDWLTLREAATLLGVAASSLAQQVRRGKLAATKRGRDWWVTRAELRRYRRESLGRPGARPRCEAIAPRPRAGGI